ncbi:hypothetical protein H5410_052392 [Solanum commersonii]|uniref:Uncharacterized protein n=1 Tax=Solanum commersonii TaxID=4109 RepID=A0A9J5X2X1_SOLCO|nr:hypothetical protein H5410_052392 [Solanum commersonii]
MSLMRTIRGEWKIPWELVERGEVKGKEYKNSMQSLVCGSTKQHEATIKQRQKPSTSLKDQNEENHDSELKAAKKQS